ncbi:MAG: hypothetical protein P1P88_26395, partial [Bacteroidales bacterium]|nr:hypothetical protein [Bacteroidales bacterium]
NGFLYGTTVFCVYFLLPVFGKEVPSIPMEMWLGWGAILGVTAWHRGRKQRISVGEQTSGIANIISAIKK